MNSIVAKQKSIEAIERGALGHDDLTEQQKQKLETMAAGNSKKKTAARLGISPTTLDIGLTRVFTKLGL